MKEVLDELKDNGYKSINYDLESSFNEALEDPDFKKLALSLKVGKNILMKYTSILEKSKIEYANCSKCKNILECRNQVEGYCYLPRVENDKLIFEYKKCKYK